MNYTAKSISINYSQAEDRIQCISQCDGDEFVRAWITRRFLGLIMPRIAVWTIKKSVQTGYVDSVMTIDSAAKTAMGLYEHELAQQQVEAVMESIPVRKIIDEFLLDNFIMSMSPKGYVNIIFAAPKDRTKLKFQVSMPQVHKIMGEFMKVSTASGWGIPDPWKTFEQDRGVMSAMIIN